MVRLRRGHIGLTSAWLATLAVIALLVITSPPPGAAVGRQSRTRIDGTPARPSLPSMLLVGDSVADSLQDALARAANGLGIAFAARTRPGCGLITGVPAYPDGREIPWGPACADGTLSFLTDAIQATHPQVVLWLSSWETADRIVDGQFDPFGTAASDAAILTKFDESRRILTSAGARLVMLTMAPRAAHSDRGAADSPDEDAHYLHLDELLRRFAAHQPDSVTVVDLAGIVCPHGPPCAELVDGVRLRPNDGGHFAGAGPAWVAPHLLAAIMRELQPAPRATFR